MPDTALFFTPDATIIKPYALMDLDDTLFQTMRKIDAWDIPTTAADDLVCASVNRDGEPLSFMSARQAAFFNWLLHSTDLIVVTARDTDEIQRVRLPFSSWQVLTHGAVIMTPDRQMLPTWAAQMHQTLIALQHKIRAIQAHLQHAQPTLRVRLHSDRFCDEHLVIYISIKHPDKDHDALKTLAQTLPQQIDNFAQDFYVHVNANNLAILPHAVHKKHAVQFLLDQHLEPRRPSFGFGDSLADVPFLQCLDWYGTPSRGQLHEHLHTSLTDE
ncbi:HAD hydrolase family protein [Psychrobacter aestuarii]|uniref:Uncharacterized protein n=1 Tax=Psychrobacter aestuarii TaxID=556327 RepID=A0ABN0VMD6_9GAMM|nr:HAD hydrolase family protein [Psychrobacter aestuarii]